MGKTVEFFFDFMSPPSYLAFTQMPGLQARTGAHVVWRPMYTIGLHQITGNRSPIMVPNKAAWIGRDLARFAKRHGVRLADNPHQPVKVVPALRGALAAAELGVQSPYIAAVFHAMWVDARDIGDGPELASILAGAGLDAEAILARTAAPEIKQALIDTTQEAADRGAFGAPSFFVDGELFWGQDRLDFVEEALSA